MARRGDIAKGLLAARAIPGAEFLVRVQPGAKSDRLEEDGETLRIAVTAPPADGKANEAVTRLLARALGVAPGRLTLVSGAAARDKRFRFQ